MKIFIAALFFCQVVSAQSYKFDVHKPEVTIPFAFFAGMCDGISQTLYGHYWEFENTFPQANRQYWDPAISWKNKYENGDPAQGENFPGSTTLFVFSTDAYHLFRTLNKVNLVTLGAFEFSDKRSFWQYVVDFTLYSIIYSAGFTLTYEVVFH